jgi:Lon protease-like protein
LPIFPLDSVVLLPQSLLPLHIFEPRYRAMTRDALERGLPIALTTPAPGAFDAQGRPLVLPVAGVGKIVQHEELEDGRYHILLFGLGRIRIERELKVDTPYRQVRAVLQQSSVRDLGEVDVQLASVRSLALAIQSIEPKVAGEVARMIDDRADPAQVADRLASMFFPDVDRRQELLEERVVERRLRVVVERMTTYLAQVSTAKAGDQALLN